MQSRGGSAKHGAGVDLSNGSSEEVAAKSVIHTANLLRPPYGLGLDYSSMALSPASYGYGYGYGYGAWTFAPPLMPFAPLLPNTVQRRGLLSRPAPSLGIQGGGILKKHPQSAFNHGRGHVNKRFNGGAHGIKNLTKEALDADLDKWRLKDKRFAGQSLDAELDKYWSKKNDLCNDAI